MVSFNMASVLLLRPGQNESEFCSQNARMARQIYRSPGLRKCGYATVDPHQSLFRLVGIRISAGPLYFAYGDEFVGAAETEGDD